MSEITACVGTASVRGSKGIYAVGVDTERGSLRVISTVESMNSGYLVLSPDKKHLYATQEGMTFRGRAVGGVAAYAIDDAQRLSFVNSVEAGGQLPCHISIHPNGSEVYVSSYLKGCISIHKVRSDGGLSPAHKVIQHPFYHDIAPSIHCSVVTDDGNYLCALNVTAHIIAFYELDSGNYEEVNRIEFGPPYNRRPRQIVFKNRIAYLLTETGKEVVVFDYNPQDALFLKQRQLLPLYPEGTVVERSAASGIKLSWDKKLLACSVRGYNLITIFPVFENGELGEPVYNKTQGLTPRDFNFTPDGSHMLVGAQQSDTLELYAVENDGTLKLVCAGFDLPCCFCVAFR